MNKSKWKENNKHEWIEGIHVVMNKAASASLSRRRHVESMIRWKEPAFHTVYAFLLFHLSDL